MFIKWNFVFFYSNGIYLIYFLFHNLTFQRKQKQRQLLGRLQDLLLGSKADEQTTCEVLDYFLRRLSSSQVASRVLAMKVINLKGTVHRSFLETWANELIHMTNTCPGFVSGAEWRSIEGRRRPISTNGGRLCGCWAPAWLPVASSRSAKAAVIWHCQGNDVHCSPAG